MLKLTNIMLLSQESHRELSEDNAAGQLELAFSFSLNPVEERPWARELTMGMDVVVTGENGENTTLMHGQNVYAVDFNENADNRPSELQDALWPYVRPDIVDYLRKYGFPSEIVPICMVYMEEEDKG